MTVPEETAFLSLLKVLVNISASSETNYDVWKGFEPVGYMNEKRKFRRYLF
jgi:hypothetical protein